MNFNNIEVGKVYKPTKHGTYEGYGFMKVVEKMPRDHYNNVLKKHLVKVHHSQDNNFDFAMVRWVSSRDLEEL